MTRVARIVGRWWKASLDAELEYRANFVIAALASIGNLFGSVFSLSLFYAGGGGFEGWTLDQGLIVLGMFTIFTGLASSLLSPNLSRIVGHIEQGTLDFALLKPVDAQLQMSLRVVSPWGAPDLVFGVALVWFAAIALVVYGLFCVISAPRQRLKGAD